MIGIISDTHDNVGNVIKAVELFKRKGCDLVIHSGDIVAPATVPFFKGLNMVFVKGNCDGDIEMIRAKAEEIGGKFFLENHELEYHGKRIAVTHGKYQTVLTALIDSQRFDYVLHGHTHKSRDEHIGKTRVINPGAHYYGAENTISLLDPAKDIVEFVRVV